MTNEIQLYDDTRVPDWYAGETPEKFNQRFEGKTQYYKAKEYLENINQNPSIGQLSTFIRSKNIKPVIVELINNKVIHGVTEYLPKQLDVYARLSLRTDKVRCKYCFTHDNKAFWLYKHNRKEHLMNFHYAKPEDFVQPTEPGKYARWLDWESYFTTEEPRPKTRHKWGAAFFVGDSDAIEITCSECGRTERFYPTVREECEGKDKQ